MNKKHPNAKRQQPKNEGNSEKNVCKTDTNLLWNVQFVSLPNGSSCTINHIQYLVKSSRLISIHYFDDYGVISDNVQPQKKKKIIVVRRIVM